MGEDFFEYLPSDIIVNILSRLPTQDAMACKCVCKPWLILLATPEFVNSHISRSVPGLAFQTYKNSYDVIEIADELDFDEEYPLDGVFSFELPFDEPIISSANGLIFLSDFDHDDLILCNPITRDYIKLPCPRQNSSNDRIDRETFGFGVSRMTGQYKVVRIFVEIPLEEGSKEECTNECQVYTVGTGSWRKVSFGSLLRLCEDLEGVPLNGYLHWMVDKSTEGLGAWISCFDLETELSSTFSAPPPLDTGFLFDMRLTVLRDCLCASDISMDGCVIIWLMNEDDKSWTKEFVIPEIDRLDEFVHVRPINAFENGDLLMEWEDGKLFYFSNKTKTLDYEILMGPDHEASPTTMYASSFLSLKSFVMENVTSF